MIVLPRKSEHLALRFRLTLAVKQSVGSELSASTEASTRPPRALRQLGTLARCTSPPEIRSNIVGKILRLNGTLCASFLYRQRDRRTKLHLEVARLLRRT